MKRIAVLLAEDHLVLREGVRRMIELEDDLEVVGEAQNGRQAVALAKKLRPNVVLMDIAMPLLNGLEAARQIARDLPATKVLMLSERSEDAYVQHATESGAMGYLLKQTSSARDVCRAIREIQKGKTVFSPSITKHMERQRLPDWFGQSRKQAPKLTSRETEVLQLIAEGKANKEIAAELGIARKTAEKHREHLMQKLDIHDTAGLTRHAISTGVIESGVEFNTAPAVAKTADPDVTSASFSFAPPNPALVHELEKPVKVPAGSLYFPPVKKEPLLFHPQPAAAA
jgi:DNA-binding NarL/FixJ family response regulator